MMKRIYKYFPSTLFLALSLTPVTQAIAENNWIITPRAWIVNSSTENTSDPNSYWKDVNFTLYGLSVEYITTSLDNLSYILTYYTSMDEYTTDVISQNEFGVIPGR